MSYPSALDRLYGRIPRGVRLGLDRVLAAAEALGSPHLGLRCVQVAGTNGKGAVAGMIAHAAGEAGLKTGLFTSPHLHRFSERIRLDGDEAPDDLLGPVLIEVLDLADSRDDLALTFFEIATLAALVVFAERGVELAVLEVGLGGRLDATSICAPAVAAITSIGLDHQDLLGNTIEEIAAEKAGVARPGVPLVVGALPAEAAAVIREIAGRVGAPLSLLDRDFARPDGLKLPWPGEHQLDNAALALSVFELLGREDPRLSRRLFLDAAPATPLPGRYERLPTEPAYLLDGAHNLPATRALVSALEGEGQGVAAVIFGALMGKPAAEMLELIRGRCSRIILAPPPLERARDPRELAREGDLVAGDVAEALALADQLVGPEETVLVTGSLFTVAEARRILLDEPADPAIAL